MRAPSETFFSSRWVDPPAGIEELAPGGLAPGFAAAGVACGVKGDKQTTKQIVQIGAVGPEVANGFPYLALRQLAEYGVSHAPVDGGFVAEVIPVTGRQSYIIQIVEIQVLLRHNVRVVRCNCSNEQAPWRSVERQRFQHLQRCGYCCFIMLVASPTVRTVQPVCAVAWT